MQYATRSIETPLGRYVLAATAQGLTHLQLAGANSLPEPTATPCPESRAHLARAERALGEYFAGSRRDFADLDLAPRGSRFQQRVWLALRKIPFGDTASYGEVARRIGSDGAARAVGAANHDNPLGIVVPCHRVIGADGRLTGYAGGLDRKRWLLAHEGASLAC